jgi:peptidoglycan/xylan/chitin deacetylase (PgdA/CDA1 family)
LARKDKGRSLRNNTFSVLRHSLGAFILFATAFLADPSVLSGQEVAITFDDLPNHGPLPSGETREDVARKILAAFKAAKVPEVYGFINAGRMQDHSDDIEVLKLWRAAGQPLGNHTFQHMSLNNNALAAFEENIAKDEPTLQSLMGKKDWHWFRYPYLDEGDTLEKRRSARTYLQDHHYRIAQVTLDFQDYAWNPAYARCTEKHDDKTIAWLRDSYLSTATEYMKLGRQLSQQIFHRDIKYILLMHIGAFDAEMLPQLLAQMKQQSFKFITLKKAESDPAYGTDPDAIFKDGGTLLDQIMEARQLQYPPHAEKPMQELEAACKQ